MCGINAFFTRSTTHNLESTISVMNSALEHRGPDSSGSWVDPNSGLVLGHQRLAIQDLSVAGRQPMSSKSGRYVLIFNGEVYNHLNLRNRLIAERSNLSWNGSSDTETLLSCFEIWGVVKTLSNLVGMFAFVLWDRDRCVLTLARDRLGEKPLYWGWQGSNLYISSELGSIKANPYFKANINRDALGLLLKYNFIPAPYSIYSDVKKLRAGHVVEINLNDLECKHLDQTYWSLKEVVEDGNVNREQLVDNSPVDTLERLLTLSLKDQMLSDVPLGAFLSGGVDSSAIAALMQSQSSTPIKTFTIGFRDSAFDEALFAKDIANHIGTDHTELYVSDEDVINVVPQLSSIYSEPLADSSQIPTFLLCRLASQHVKVALSGDGGDEVFGGYNRYLTAAKLWKYSQYLPRSVRNITSTGLSSISPQTWELLARKMGKTFLGAQRTGSVGDNIQKVSNILKTSSEQDFYHSLISHWERPAEVILGASNTPTLFDDLNSLPNADCFEHTMMALDSLFYMPDDVLVKVDRAAMANSLETRVPFLDHRIVEWAWSLPFDYKIRNGDGKWILRQVLYRHVPKTLLDRPKTGFSVPLASWLRGPLREWAENLLDEKRLIADGYFNAAVISKTWQDHISGRHNNQHKLWSILMFQSWLDSQNL